MRKIIFAFLITLLVLVLAAIAEASLDFHGIADELDAFDMSTGSARPAPLVSPYLYDFSLDGRLPEAADGESKSPYWWLNSGALMISEGGKGKTIQGKLWKYSKWRVLYAQSNPKDTDNGYHPQNIFRLVGRSKWLDYSQQAYFRVTKGNFSDSPNRNESNGLLLMSRYSDSDNLYYAGIRVDGSAVIKKKKGGVYHTFSQTEKFFSGRDYDRETNPSLIPGNTWIGLRSEIKNEAGGVSIKLYVDKGKTGKWTLATEAFDDGLSYGGEAFLKSGYAGIRTDFMDVEFDNYKLISIGE
ncbi:hypothetical protein C4572_02295 [Candidatus Parcubacteria bacterium]|nr:MAG: hypothetical protein C4572_02295 [Candidatus Parcubacteria bacterium]